jgi:hypothetical protein
MADLVLDVGIVRNARRHKKLLKKSFWSIKVIKLSLGSYMASLAFDGGTSPDFECKVEEVSLRVLSTGWFSLNHVQM